MNGRYDENYYIPAQIELLFKLLGEPKKLVVYGGGHLPPLEIAVPLVNSFLDEYLGPVKHD